MTFTPQLRFLSMCLAAACTMLIAPRPHVAAQGELQERSSASGKPKSPVPRGEAAAEQTAVGRIESEGPTNAATGGQPCAYDWQCSDLDLCTLDRCATATCAGGTWNGFPCEQDSDCGGVCSGGVSDGLSCVSDLDCCGDGVSVFDGFCVFNSCSALTGSQCVNAVIPAGQFLGGSECDDGLYCNGYETCTASTCVAGTPPCSAALVCDESKGTCAAPCLADAACDDGLACTGEFCDVRTCVGGGNDGGACRSDVDCGVGSCTGGGSGLCVRFAGPCGLGGGCSEPTTVGGAVTCEPGRCCGVGGACTAATFENCQTSGGAWLATDSACQQLSSGADNGCPLIGSGIAPQTYFVVAVGPIVTGPAGALNSVGDDYSIAGAGGFVEVGVLRFAADVHIAAQIAIRFLDSGGNFVEGVTFPEDQRALSPGGGVFTVYFDPPVTVPDTGFVSMSIGAVTPEGAVSWHSTDFTDVGTNDDTLMLVDGASMPPGFLGMCAGGSRDGRWCDFTGGGTDCPDGGTCTDIPDVLAFEIVAQPTPAPLGACCDSNIGTCTDELAWVCRNIGGVFQGVGTICKACSNDPFRRCTAASDCPACQGCGGQGCNDGDACDPDFDCQGGQCVSFFCVGGSNAGAFCDVDVNCGSIGTCGDSAAVCNDVTPLCGSQACCDSFNGSCTPIPPGASCPVGTISLGFGSSCEPNLCAQPDTTGGDNCRLVSTPSFTVPASGSPPITKTVSGNNAPATFDDWVNGECVGGTGAGSLCDPSTTPDPCSDGTIGSGGACTRLCGAEIFNPAGSTRDLGWWEGFFINTCAMVRIDLCGTTDLLGVPLDPAWGNLYAGCPCPTTTIAHTGVDAPVGLGDGTEGSARGEPFCNDDNRWLTFGPLEAGTYYYPIHSASNGTGAVPPGAPYQLHITVSACQVAACCTGDTCQITNELDCATRGGQWLAGAEHRRPRCDGGANDGQICVDTGQCPGGSCVAIGDVVECQSGACNEGACCVDVGDCQDRNAIGNRFDRAECDILGGTYVGGARCQLNPMPCAACSAEQPGNCQFPDGERTVSADRTNGPGRIVADDFVVVSTEIDQLCWWPVFTGDGIGCGDPFPPDGQPAPPTDDWEVRFYQDNNGVPGTLVHEIAPVSVSAKTWRGEGSNIWQYSTVFNPPLQGFNPGDTYWVEISGAGDSDCSIGLLASSDGNGFSLQEHSHFRDEAQAWTFQDHNRAEQDIAFCLGAQSSPTLDVPQPILGACCECNGVCQDDVVWKDCLGFAQIDPLTGALVEIPPTIADAVFSAGSMCTEIVCSNQGGAGGCPSGSPVEEEDCVFPKQVFDGSTTFDTTCSSTDGRAGLYQELGCGELADSTFEKDRWYTYHASTTGTFQFDLCGDTDFNVAMAVYSNGTIICPTVCPPPLGTLLGDQCRTEVCAPAMGDPTFEFRANQGDCFLIRIGGHNGDAGAGQLTIARKCCVCESDTECDDGDACTSDVCDFTGVCTNIDIAIGADECCNTSTGTLTNKNDGQVCTTDTCSGGGNRGNPINTPNTDPCDDGDECTFPDTCDGVGFTDNLACVGISSLCAPCCFAVGACAFITPSACQNANGISLGIAACLGDANGNGVDDACDGIVPAGNDCYRHDCNVTFTFGDPEFVDLPPIPADFFAPGSIPFGGTITLRGAVGQPSDTIFTRGEMMVFGPPPSEQTVSIELLSLDLESCAPITVDMGNNTTTMWNVTVSVPAPGSTYAPAPGTLTALKTGDNGGTFQMSYLMQPIFAFSRQDDPSDVRIFNTGQAGIPPLQLNTLGDASFVHRPAESVAICGENWAPGIFEQPDFSQCCRRVVNVGRGVRQEGVTPNCTGGTGVTCAVTGACCSGEGTCDDTMDSIDCLSTPGNVYKGDFTDCTTDTDGDNIVDVLETDDGCLNPDNCNTGTSPTLADTDGDGCSDDQEQQAATPTDACDTCDYSASCVDLTNNDCNGNGERDDCDIDPSDPDGNGQISADCDGNGVPDECSPTPNGACCNGIPGCALMTQQACLDLGTQFPATGWTYQGNCTRCPTQNTSTAEHDGVAVVHFPVGAQECAGGALLATNRGCLAVGFIDAWKTDVDSVMRHTFGIPESPAIPAGFFGLGSDAYTGFVELEGSRLGSTSFGEFGQADTLIRRFADPFDRCDVPSPVPSTVDIEIVALNLVSTAAIIVTFNGGASTERWGVSVDVGDVPPTTLGSLTAVKTHCNGGTYNSVLPVFPRFTFKRCDPAVINQCVPEPFGPTEVLDTGLAGLPEIILVQNANAPWSHDLEPEMRLPVDPCTGFHPGVEDQVKILVCDCDGNGLRDKCDIESDASLDCTGNGSHNACDIAAGAADCDGNNIPDQCEPDCNGNGVVDACDLNATDPDGNGLVSADCDGNNNPDECDPDCNGNDVPDTCDVDLSDPDGNGLVSSDCNSNGVPDKCESDCNDNGIADACEFVVGGMEDGDGNGLLDACDCNTTILPLAPVADPNVVAKPRYLSFAATTPGTYAIKITLVDLPGAFSVFNGESFWAGKPVELTEQPGVVFPSDAPPGVATYMGATLSCTAVFENWNSIGTVHLHDELIIPGATYEVRAIEQGCGLNVLSFFSAPLAVTLSAHGDTVGLFDSDTGQWTAPDGSVGIPSDVVACLDKFSGFAGAPDKVRCDLVPSDPDGIISITDIAIGVDAFQSKPFPFAPPVSPCP